MANTFQQDVEFLNRYADTVILGDPDKAAIVMVPGYQGRVMTSTAGGQQQNSFGWINYELIESQQKVPQINLYGGEERFWLAPEGGRYSIFFPPADLEASLDFADWRVPECIDTDGFRLVTSNENSAVFRHQANLRNRFNYQFQIGFDRTVRLLNVDDVCSILDGEEADLAGVRVVAHQSENCLSNMGAETWKRETGLLSIWVLCMNSPSPSATLIVPYKSGDVSKLGSIVNADYFGKLERDRLWIDQNHSLIYLKGDGAYRSKLGLTHPRVQPLLGAWDEDRRVLTVISFNLPDFESEQAGLVRRNERIEYVNNVWRVLEDEYNGDVINGYNDGPNESGERLGGFFELESLSPALALSPNDSYTHIHRTVRLQADSSTGMESLNRISQRMFGVSLQAISKVFE